MASRILHFAKTRPLAFGMGFSLVKTSGADLMVQKVLEQRETIDWKRNIAFGSFGLFYLGGVQYVLYVPIFSRLFPRAASFAAKSVADKVKDMPGIRGLFAQVFLDQAVHHPLMYFPIFYCVKDLVTSDFNPDPVGAVNEYRKNAKEDLQALWKIWLPSTILNFAFMPMWARVPWVASTSLIWTCVLSAMRGGSDVPAPAMVGNAVDARTMEYFTRTELGPAPTLDPTREHLLVIAHGPDQQGVIRELARTVYEHGASITASKMMSLGTDFSVMMHIDLPKENLKRIKKALASGVAGWDSVELSAHDVSRHDDDPAKGMVMPAYSGQVRLIGERRPGLLYRMVEILSAYGLNIEHLQSEQHVRSTGGQLFHATCVVTGAKHPDVAALKAALLALEKELDVSCILEPKMRRLASAKSMTR